MGERTTAFVTWTWVITALGFFVLIGYRLLDQGANWLRHSSEPLVALGIIALSCYLAVMFNEAAKSRQQDAKKIRQDQREALESIWALLTEQKTHLREVESAVYNLARQIRN
jgi:hypothetical protein